MYFLISFSLQLRRMVDHSTMRIRNLTLIESPKCKQSLSHKYHSVTMSWLHALFVLLGHKRKIYFVQRLVGHPNVERLCPQPTWYFQTPPLPPCWSFSHGEGVGDWEGTAKEHHKEFLCSNETDLQLDCGNMMVTGIPQVITWHRTFSLSLSLSGVGAEQWDVSQVRAWSVSWLCKDYTYVRCFLRVESRMEQIEGTWDFLLLSIVFPLSLWSF